MSDLMLHGVLNMPLPDDPREMSALQWRQFRSRARQASAHIDAQDAKIKALVEALGAIDKDLDGRNFLKDSSLRDKTRAALAAAKETI